MGIMFMKPHGRLRAGFKAFRNALKARSHMLPVIQGRLKRAGNMPDFRAFRQVLGNNDEFAVSCGIFECCQFQDMSLSCCVRLRSAVFTFLDAVPLLSLGTAQFMALPLAIGGRAAPEKLLPPCP